MRISRRELVKLWAGAGASFMLGWRPRFWQESPLIHRAIPSTGETVPAVGIGARNYRVGPSATERAPFKATLRVFAELGGKLVDTAPSYGNSETVVGDLVAELGTRDDLFLATKVDREGREAGIERMEASMRFLRTDRIDLMQVHNLRDSDTQLGTLREWKAQGRIRYLGVTTSSARQYEALGRIMERETLDFVQINYSLGARGAAERLLPLAADRGMAVLINLPFGRGRLFRRVGDRPLPGWAAEFDCESWGQFFLKYVLSHPAVTCPIPGTTKEHHAVDNMGAARGRLPDMALRRRMEEFYDALPEG
jgi:aryl-alcohol dehydrogenase-like predicted oxidoreductase